MNTHTATTPWHLHFHRTIQTAAGTKTQDIYSLRRSDISLPFYTIGVPHGETELVHELVEAMNHRVVYETPMRDEEFEKIFWGPWSLNTTTKLRSIAVTEDEHKWLASSFMSLRSRNLTLQHELANLKAAHSKLEHAYNVQSQVLMRLREQVGEKRIQEMNDLFVRNSPEYQPTFPRFEHGAQAQMKPPATKRKAS